MTAAANRLGTFLRARRVQADPASLGVDATNRRRGEVRRADVAALAGMSAPYLARLEQGSDRNPSPRVVDELGRALQLDDFQLGHLRLLAGLAPAPSTHRGHRIRPGLKMLMSSWTDQPAFVQDRYGTVLAANELAVALCPIFRPGTNVLQWLFTAPQAQESYPDWVDVVHRVVGDVLATSAIDPYDREFCALVDDLATTSATFASLWSRQEVLDKTVGLKRFRTPRADVITLNWECFNVSGDDWLFVFFAEPGTPDFESLMRLKRDTQLATGAQNGRQRSP